MLLKKVCVCLLACLATVSTLSACGTAADPGIEIAPEENGSSAQQEKKEILIYHYMGEMADYLNQMCAEFNQGHPYILLSTELQKDSNTLQIKYAANEDPDIVFGAASQQYIDMGKYLDYKQQPQWLDRMDPVMVELFTDIKTGGVYKIPMGKGFTGVFYNKRIYEELGLEIAETWDAFIENLRVIKEEKPDIEPFYIVSNDYFNMTLYSPYALKALDVGIVAMKEAININDKAILNWDVAGGYFEQFAEKLITMRDEELINSELALTSTQQMLTDAFATGKVASTITGTFWSGPLLRQYPEVAEYMGVAPLPSLDARGGYVGSGSDTTVAMSAVNVDNRDAIFTVIDYLFQPENLKNYCSARRVACAFKDVELSDWSPIADQILNLWAKYPNIAAPDKPSSFDTADWSKFGQELIVGGYSPQQYAKVFNEAWDAAY
jgi:ABC-type glycerol-3-phosphate transport system substrate-binding protein